MSRVTLEYESGLTCIYEGQALEDWSNQYWEALNAWLNLKVLSNLRTQEAQAAQAPAEEPAPATRSLRDVLSKP